MSHGVGSLSDMRGQIRLQTKCKQLFNFFCLFNSIVELRINLLRSSFLAFPRDVAFSSFCEPYRAAI